MERCFVIQPFDSDKYDRRFNETYSPAIINAGLEPYRIDKDYSVRIPIEDIEKEIKQSILCFAEISTDNPNVWYELGYAFACKKDVVMVCDDERNGKYPFDIQHRNIIIYKTGSKGDFEKLENEITNTISAFLKNSKTIKKLELTPIQPTEGLKSHEITALIIIMENSISQDEHISMHWFKSGMNRAGFNDLAASVAVRTLSLKGLIETFLASDYDGDGENYPACRLTEEGEKWILDNQDQLIFRTQIDQNNEADTLPF